MNRSSTKRPAPSAAGRASAPIAAGSGTELSRLDAAVRAHANDGKLACISGGGPPNLPADAKVPAPPALSTATRR